MPLSQLDPHTALIVVDLQKGIIGQPLVDPITPIIENITALLHAFRSAHRPVVLVNVAGSAPGRTEQPPRVHTFPEGWTTLVPELNVQSSDLLVTKHSWGAFQATGLAAQLRALAITQVVVAGIATATGVEATARQAYESGFNVTLPLDAMTDTRVEAQAYSKSHVFPRLAETGATQQVLHLLSQRGS